MPRLILAALLALAACTPSDPGADLTPEALSRDWRLVAWSDPGPLPPRATMDLRDPARAVGQAPCNRWFGAVEGPLPAFRIPMAGSTRMACPDLEAETRFLAALSQVERAALDSPAQAEGPRLILTGQQGLRLEFLPQTP